jgi:quercetin 2,3-dioxygenase
MTQLETLRPVLQVLRGMATSDGAGVKLARVIGQPALRNFDPFLMLDRFHSDDPGAYIAGFPEHPHRGFETVTIMLEGRMRHKDSRGNEGLIVGGGAQWMTAGRGILHSEMPEQQGGFMSGFQLWINLPSTEKMCEPVYQDLQPEALAHATLAGSGQAHVIAGELFGVRGPVRARPSEPMLAHVTLGPNESHTVPVPHSHKAFVFVSKGSIQIAGGPGQQVSSDQIAILGDGDHVQITSESAGAELLFAAGKPFGEPIAQHGPFVMNTNAELEQAFADYRRGTLGRD